ncbi:hypothetical protein F2Q68_00031644 [Brassica cretica]|uniref:Uncharacterized protein n=1 Tax=Brassica cretica TaxID=69181 RepID=A0A8S9GE74_BRACR|nr:hypothetical protein F2Q68_00031644 [Brassica cretica]
MSVCLCSNIFCFPIKHQGQNLSLLCPKFMPMLRVLLFHYEYKSGLEEPKPYDIVAADPGYVRTPISLLFWLIFRFGTNPQERGSNILLRVRTGAVSSDMSVCLFSSFFCFPIKHQGQNLSLLCPKFMPMLCVLLFHYEYKKLFCVCVPRFSSPYTQSSCR